MALHIRTRLQISGPKMKQAGTCCCGCCNISWGTDATNSMDIIVLWDWGFTASFLLCDFHKTTPKFLRQRLDMVLGQLGHLYKKIYYYSFKNGDMVFFVSFLSCCGGSKVLRPFPITLHSQASFIWYFVFVASCCWLSVGVTNLSKYGATHHYYHQGLSG